MTSETQVIKFEITETLATEFPEFKELELYGDSENPLFPVKRTAELLGISKIHIDRKEYVRGKDYIQTKGRGKDGKMYEQNMLTERGLYKVIALNNTEITEKFYDFIFIVMRELRTTGHVALDDALKKLQVYEQQMDQEHQLLQKYQRDSERYYLKYNNVWTENQVLKDRLQRDLAQANRYNAEFKLQYIEQKLFKPLWVYISKPPKAIEDEFDEWNPDVDPTDDEEICFQLSNKARLTGATAEIRIMPDLGIAKIKDTLKDRGFAIRLPDDKTHDTIFRGTMDDLRTVIDDLMY